MKTEYEGGDHQGPSSLADALMQEEFRGFQEEQQQQQQHDMSMSMSMCLHEEQKQHAAPQYTAGGQGGVAVIGGVHEVVAAAVVGGGCQHGFNCFPSDSTTTVLPWNIPSLHSPTIISAATTAATTANSNVSVSNHAIHQLQDHVRLYPPPPPPMPPYADFYPGRRASGFQFGYEGGFFPSDPLGLAGLYLGSSGGGGGVPEGFFRSGGGGGLTVATSPFSALQSEFGKMTAQEIMDAKALAASKSHSEAERRRRERINAHLAKLRSLLPSTTKTDKASLLAEVIQHVKELKRQTSEITEESPVPTESDELTVDAASDEDGKLVVKASMCCDDRSDLLTELIKALKALRLRALKAEITTLGGRVKNVLVITGEDDSEAVQLRHSITSIQDALKAVMERTASDDPSAAVGSSGGGSSLKRQRTATSLSSILENRST